MYSDDKKDTKGYKLANQVNKHNFHCTKAALFDGTKESELSLFHPVVRSKKLRNKPNVTEIAASKILEKDHPISKEAFSQEISLRTVHESKFQPGEVADVRLNAENSAEEAASLDHNASLMPSKRPSLTAPPVNMLPYKGAFPPPPERRNGSNSNCSSMIFLVLFPVKPIN